VQIGSLTLKSNLFLSPLAGYTTLPFRLVVREIGGVGLCTTDLVNARSLLEKRAPAFKLIETRPEDSPLAVQLFGSVPEEMRDAALVVEAHGAASVDINMGCPVKKVCKVGGGSAMMTELDKTTALVRGIVNAVKIPVTAKMRLGWDDQNITAPDLASALEDAGVSAIFIHGRTREQGFGGTVNLAGIRRDIVTPPAAKKMLDETGCAGVSIGRGAFYDPWIFKRTLHLLQTGQMPPEEKFSERIQLLCRHLDLMVEVFGEAPGCRMFRKIAPWYARRFGPSHEFNKNVVHITNRAQFQEVLDHYLNWRKQFLDEHGELQVRFQPRPLVASFMGRPDDAPPPAISVPHGVVERW
jgi:nifR3 family TIM-barrel protein